MPPPFRMPMMDQPQGFGLPFQQQPLTDEEQAIAELAAIEKQYQTQSQQALPEQMGPPGFLERLFNAGVGQPSFVPMSPVSGFLSGLAGGLAGRGQKVAQKRQQIENLIAQQRQQNQQQQLEDFRARRTAAFQELSNVRTEHRKATAEQQKQGETMTVVSPDLVKANPDLAPLAGKFIPNTTIASAAFRKKAGAQENDDIANSIADAVRSGDQSPDLRGLYKYGAAVRANLAKSKYNLAGAQKDWMAVQKNIASLNGTQQTRLRQAVETAYSSLDVVDGLSADLTKELKSSRTPVTAFNRAVMIAARNGVYGPKAKDLATQLEAQIGDVASEIGNAYMGGNSPTDHALALAQKNLNANWDERTLRGATDLARKNLQIRRNSIYNSTPIIPGQMPPPMQGAAPRKIPVATPDGVFYFDSEDAAQAFRDEAGIE